MASKANKLKTFTNIMIVQVNMEYIHITIVYNITYTYMYNTINMHSMDKMYMYSAYMHFACTWHAHTFFIHVHVLAKQ